MSLLAEVSLMAFIQENQIKTESGTPLDFRTHKYLYDIYCDRSNFLCCLKAAQIGFTTYEIIKSLHEAKTENQDAIYVLPTADDVKQFSGGKTNRIIANNPVFQTWTEDKDSVEQKRVGKATIYYRGCFDKDTEVLTFAGWKKYDEVLIGDGLPTINLATHELEEDTVKDLTIFDAQEEMVRLESATFDVLMTKDHRCIVEDRKTGRFRIKPADALKRGSSASFIPLRTRGLHRQGDISPQISSVLGWVISEGSYWTERWRSHFTREDGTRNPHVIEYPHVSIHQKKYKDVLRKCLKDAGFGFREKNDRRGVLAFELGRRESRLIRELLPVKELTFELLSRMSFEAMEALYESFILGDGSRQPMKEAFYQKSKQTSDAFQALCVFLGKNARLSKREFKMNDKRFSHDPIWVTQVKFSKNGSNFKKSIVPYVGVAWCPTTRNGTVVSRRNGKIFLTGQSWTERTALMISARKLIIDELDRCKPDIVEQYDSRLQHATSPKKAFFSNPTIPDFGIDKYWKQSDKKKWHITHSCGAKFPLIEENIDFDRELFICRSCNQEITTEERRNGEWIATDKGEWSGYWIPLWLNPMFSAKDIAKYKREKTPEYFTNFVAGLPYAGGGDKVAARTIINCLSSVVNSHAERVIIGVDSGLPFHIVTANKEGYFYYDKLQEPEKELVAFLKRWPKSIIVADQGGDLILMRKLQQEYPGRVFLVWYRRDKKGLEIIKWGEGDEYGKVEVDRNRMIQLFIDEMLDKRVTFNGSESEWQEYITHWLNIYRAWEENTMGIKEFKWERTGPDHYVHASIYARVGLSRFAETMAKIVGGEDVFGRLPKGQIVDDTTRVVLGGLAEL